MNEFIVIYDDKYCKKHVVRKSHIMLLKENGIHYGAKQYVVTLISGEVIFVTESEMINIARTLNAPMP